MDVPQKVSSYSLYLHICKALTVLPPLKTAFQIRYTLCLKAGTISKSSVVFYIIT